MTWGIFSIDDLMIFDVHTSRSNGTDGNWSHDKQHSNWLVAGLQGQHEVLQLDDRETGTGEQGLAPRIAEVCLEHFSFCPVDVHLQISSARILGPTRATKNCSSNSMSNRQFSVTQKTDSKPRYGSFLNHWRFLIWQCFSRLDSHILSIDILHSPKIQLSTPI